MTAAKIIYNMPAAEYHAHPSYSASDLLAFRESPQLLADRRAGIAPFKETKSMLLGTGAHLSMLEPERFASVAVVRPDIYGGGKKWNMNAHECQAWVAWQTQEGKVIFSADEMRTIELMQARMPAEIRELMRLPSECSAFRDVYRCRPDLLDLPGRAIYDLKTIRDIGKIERQSFALNYHLRAEFYREVLDFGGSFTMLFVESQAPFRWRVVDLDAEYRMMAQDELERLLYSLKDRIALNDWSDPEPIEMTISPPTWATANDEDEL